MTAVIYARYSSDNQREESIEGQIRECTAYAEKNGITIVKHYIDCAISAKTDNRPEFQQMIKDSDKKLFDIVLVWKLDRFARNRYDSARYKTQLKKNGVKLMSATEVISDGPEGIILESVLEGYAEYYSADLSEKVVRGMTENALKGKFSGGAIPFGYTIDADRRFEIDPLTAPFVAETFQRYNDGQTMREIRDWLNEKGIKKQARWADELQCYSAYAEQPPIYRRVEVPGRPDSRCDSAHRVRRAFQRCTGEDVEKQESPCP